MIISLQKLIDKKNAVKQGAMRELLTGKSVYQDFLVNGKENSLKKNFLVIVDFMQVIKRKFYKYEI